MRITTFSVLALIGSSSIALAQGLAPHTITVQGQAEIMAAPDYASVDMGVVSTAKSVAAAAQENNALMARVVSALARLNVPEKDVQTTKYNVEAIHPRNANGQEDESKTLAYQVANKVTVNVFNMANLAKVIDAAAQSGANTIDSIEFGVKDRGALEDEARTAAIKNARHQAEVMAAAESAKVVKVIAMTSGNVSYGVETITVSASRLRTTPILPGQVRIGASATVQFGLE